MMNIFRKKKKPLAIWGWWEGHNLGDNWIKRCMRKIFPAAEFIDTRTQNIDDWSFVICGGGGLWIDQPIPPFSEKVKTHFGVIGLGAEFPHINDRAQELFKQADFFFVRDQYTLDCLRIKDAATSRDITFYDPLSWIESENDVDTNHLFFVFRGGSDFVSKPNDPMRRRFVEYMHYRDNQNVFESIVADKFRKITSDDFQTTEENVEERIGNCGFVISGRFHGIIMAIQRGLPCIAVDICPKIRALMEDCGLEEYIIKMDEVDKLPELIDRARANIKEIREKQAAYRSQAVSIINNDVAMAQLIVDKHLSQEFGRENYPDAPHGIHYGAYWMGENDVINVMADDLADLCHLTKIDLKIYTKKPDKRIKKHIKTPNGDVNYLDTKLIIRDIEKYQPNFILLNSGGITLKDEGFAYCKSKGITVVGTAMSDPDVYPHNGALYAHKFDLFYTNARYSLENQYDKSKVNIKLMPFAASTKHHFPMRDVEKKYDVVVIGHARPDRLCVIEQLSDFKVGLYGNGWGDKANGPVHGLDHVRAINSGKIYLNFAGTVAGYQNIKVGLFEAIACRTCVLVSHMDELSHYFTIGKEVLCYKDQDELVKLLRQYLADDKAREAVYAASYNRFLQEHTYKRRFVNMLRDIFSLKKSQPAPSQEKKRQLSAAEWGSKYTVAGLQKLLDSLSQDAELSQQSREMLKISGGRGKIMEVGSGSGQSSLRLALAGAEVTLLDYAAEPLELARKAADALGLKIKTIQHDLLAPPPAELEQYDIIFHAGLLEHFDKDVQIQIIKNLQPYCKRMVSLVPNAASLAYRLGKAQRELDGTWAYGREDPLYTQLDIFAAAGFRVTAEYTIGNLNATNFLDDKHPLKAMIKELVSKNLLVDDWHQGYLLVTVGESIQQSH